MLNLLAISYGTYKVLSIICLIVSVLVSLFVIAVVIMQPGNSNGIGAVNGQSETFYGKNKNKTLESKMKKLTVISVIILAVCMILFYVLHLIKGI
ncbi:MAG: preprotein translocase subunit SecG [Clostridia bacterium]|nr:preprotein translocase subunit SecG [Clostridia bacterium]